MRILIAVSILLALLCEGALAHPRDYLVTYPYWTLPKGRFEVELKTDYVDPGLASPDYFLHQTEVEYGVTDRLTLGLYGVWKKQEGRAARYQETKLEARYRLAEPGRLYFNPALYGEYVKGSGSQPDKVEAKLLLQRYLSGSTNVALNATLEHELGSEEWEKSYTAGIARRVSSKTTVGVEVKGGEGELYLIPGAYIDLAFGRRLNIGPAFGLTKESKDFQIKTILELEF